MPRDYTRGKTSVFWDVEDFPVPEGRRIREIIVSALQKKGYKGEVSIKAYGESEMNPFPAKENLDGEFTYIPKRDKYWRLNKMLIDIGWWTVENPQPHFTPSNLMVVAKNIDQDTEFLYLLEGLSASYYNVILVVPDDRPEPEEVPLPSVDLMWRWTSLLVGEEPMPEDKSLDLVTQSRRGVSNLVLLELLFVMKATVVFVVLKVDRSTMVFYQKLYFAFFYSVKRLCFCV